MKRHAYSYINTKFRTHLKRVHSGHYSGNLCPGGGTQYKSGYRDVPQTWVAKSGRQVHQWVLFFSKMRYMDGCACFNRYIDGPFFIIEVGVDGPFFIIEVHRWAIFIIGTSMGRKFAITGTAIVGISFSLSSSRLRKLYKMKCR